MRLTFAPLADAFLIFRELFIRDLFDAVIIATALTFFIMPLYTRLVA